jgi:hypothetical protein
MVRKLASGWNDNRLPGRFFQNRKELAMRLAAEVLKAPQRERRCAQRPAPYSTDKVVGMDPKPGPEWKPGEVKVVGDTVYDGPDKLLTIKDPATRDEFVADYSTSPDRTKTYNEWRDKLRPNAPVAPMPTPKTRGGDNDEIEVSSGNWHGRAFVKKIFIPGKENKPKGFAPPGEGVPGKDKDKPGMIPIYHRGIEMTNVQSGDVVKFPLTVRGGVATFGDSRGNEEGFSGTTKPRYSYGEMVSLLSKWVGPENAKALVGTAMGHSVQASSWVSRNCKFAN